MTREPARSTRVLAWLALIVATVATYHGVAANGFLWWDDAVYVTENQHVRGGLSAATIACGRTQHHVFRQVLIHGS